MQWFSKLTQALLPQKQEENLDVEAEQLQAIVDADKKIVGELPGNVVTKPQTPSQPVGSTLSPFASRILEKAKIESLKDDSERKPIKSPAELFLTNVKLEERVGHIESLALEKSKRDADKFLKAAENQIPDTKFKVENFLKKEKNAA